MLIPAHGLEPGSIGRNPIERKPLALDFREIIPRYDIIVLVILDEQHLGKLGIVHCPL